MASTSLMSLEDIFNNNPALASVKFRIDHDKKMASVIDLICIVTGKTNRHSSECFNNLNPELTKDVVKMQFKGKGHVTPFADASTLVNIIWELPGKAAKAFRRQCAHLVCRYLGGDRTLLNEIEMKYDRVSEADKEFLTHNVERPILPERSAEENAGVLKRKIDDIAIEKERMELEERRQALLQRKQQGEIEFLERRQRLKNGEIDLKQRERECKEKEIQFNVRMKEMIPNDAEIVAACDDRIKQMMVHGQQLLEYSGSGEGPATTEGKFLPDLSEIVRRVSGKRVKTKELSAIGRVVSKAYYDEHGKYTPHKTQRYCNGANVSVNAYLKEDADLVYGAVRSYFSG